MTEPKIFWFRFAFGLLSLVFALSVVALMNPISKFSHELIRPESVDTPPLASLPRDKWPEHGLDAVERGLIWGQCGTCGFPVTTEDVLNGFGISVGFGFSAGFGSRGYQWEEFYCYRHTEGYWNNHK